VIKDRDDDWSWNRFTPGSGFVNQNTPGILVSSTVSQVLRSNVVNEMNFGYTHNRWGFKAADDFDYQSLYRSSLGIDPPRFEPFGAYSDPPKLSAFGGSQVDEWPYAPRYSTNGGNLNADFVFTGPNNSVINSPNTGKYVATGTGLAAGTIQPRTLGLTVRLDW
jgi:hypothetical protein